MSLRNTAMWKVEGAKLLLDRGADVNARAAVDEKALVDKHRFFTPSPNSMTGACLLLNYCWIAARTFRFARNFLAITNSRTKRLNVPHWDTPCSFPQPTALSQAIVQFCCASEERRNKEKHRLSRPRYSRLQRRRVYTSARWRRYSLEANRSLLTFMPS